MDVLAIGGPEEFGGTGDVREQMIVMEELAAGPPSMAAFSVLQFMGIQVLGGHGAGARRDVLRALMEGRQKVSFAMSEPGSSTDIGRSMRTRAEKMDGGYGIRGHKTWISAASIADYLLVLARTSDWQRSTVDGVTMFLVPSDASGIEIREIDTLGIHGLPTCDVHLDDLVVPDSAIVGEPERGFRNVFLTLARERLNAASASIGVARAALDYAIEYGKQREAFARPIGSFQVLQHRLMDDAIVLESARSLVVRAATIEATVGKADVLATMAKVGASDAASQITDHGMRLLAGAGFSREVPMQGWMRDVRLWTFSPMSDEMCRNFLGEHLLGLPRSY
jgi:alkylation response protein AidB-like acyl-CoA dehydrogenase